MSITPKVLVFAGSTRSQSFNKKAAQIAAAGARAAGADVTVIDLREFPLPIFDQDLEAEKGLPENGAKLKKLFIDTHGFVISSPEYNSSVSAVLKNTIDWVSRPAQGEPPLAGFQGKVAGLVSASPGALGGLRGLVHLRSILGNIGTIVLPEQFAIVKAHEAFESDGKLKDPKLQAGIEGLGKKVADTARKLMA